MNHKLVTVVSALLIFGTGVLCTQVYHSAVVQRQINESRAAVARTAKEVKRAAALRAEKKRLEKECQKSETYFKTLTPQQKAKMEAPNCKIELVQ